MDIVLSSDDLARLSPAAREEIIRLLAGVALTTRPLDESEEGLAELTVFLVKRFMENVSDLTKDLLRIFAENNGRASLAQLLEKSQYKDIRKLNGFQAGVTKRVRNVLQDGDVYLFMWDDKTTTLNEAGELIDGEYYMSTTTTDSMRKYFGI